MTRKRSGQGLVEFALVFPLFLLVFFGAIDLGRLAYSLNSVSNAARLGTRTAIVDQVAQKIRDRAAAQATALGVSSAAVSCDPGNWGATPPQPTKPSTSEQSGVCIEYRMPDLASNCSPVGLGCVAVVTVKSTFTVITPLVGSLIRPISLVSTSKEPVESICPTSTTPSSECPIP